MASLVNILDESARANSDKVALRFGDASYTYAELKERVDKLAGALVALGVRGGDHVAVASPNSNASIEVLFACARIGAVCERINVRLAARVIAQLLERSGTSVVFAAKAQMDAIEACLGEAAARPVAVLLDDEGPGGGEDACGGGVGGSGARSGALVYEDVLASAEAVSETHAIMPHDPALLLYTSGTTGMPKGVLLSHESLLFRIETDIVGMRFSHDDVFLCVLPLFHVTFVSTLAALALGGELVIAESRKPADIAADINRFGATRTALVPCLMRELADYVDREPVSLATLKLIIYGGEPVTPELLTRCLAAVPCDYLQGYGMTETAAAITMLLPEHHRDPRLLSTVGVPVAGMDVRIVDDAGEQVAADTCGEIVVKSKAVMSGYYRDAQRTTDVLRDGWYRTGDIGRIDDRGFLTLVDRKDNMVITGGENVYPLEVARCIKGIGREIADVAVVGVADPRWGETLAAFVVRAAGSSVTESDIAAHCARELGSYKKPRIVRFVDDLARSASGKITKEHLENLKRLV